MKRKFKKLNSKGIEDILKELDKRELEKNNIRLDVNAFENFFGVKILPISAQE